jgi:hypothetical protein
VGSTVLQIDRPVLLASFYFIFILFYIKSVEILFCPN